MVITKTFLWWVTFVSAIPFLYFVFSSEPHNWLYYTSLALLLAATAGILVIDWQTGERKKVKARLLVFGIYALILGALMIYQLFIKK